MIEINYRRKKLPLDYEDVVVEIGFGNGDFLIEIARRNLQTIHIGIEVSGISIGKLVRKVRSLGLKNVRCARIDAYWGMQLLFKDNAVSKIYMNFPDPWPKERHSERRLTNLRNLFVYARKLKIGGEIHIRTDEYFFVEYTMGNADELSAFSINYETNPEGLFETKYERKWKEEGKTIHYLKLLKLKEPKQLNVPVLKEVDELPHVKTRSVKWNFETVLGKAIRIDEGLIVKFFKLWKDEEGNMLIETLLVENGYKHYFLTQVKRKDDSYIISVSPFSEVLKTEGVKKFIHFIADTV